MLSDWSYAGQSPDNFWRSTPRDFSAVMDGQNRARRDQFNLVMRQSHTTAILGRVEKMPDIDDLLIGKKRTHSSGQVSASEGLSAWAAVFESMSKARG